MGRALWGSRQRVGMALTLGHIQPTEAAVETGSGAGRGGVSTVCGSRVAPLPRDRDTGHLSPTWGGSGLEGWC